MNGNTVWTTRPPPSGRDTSIMEVENSQISTFDITLSAVARVIELYHARRNTVIRLVVCTASPMSVVLRSHSSTYTAGLRDVSLSKIPSAVVMNFATHEAMYSMYPKATFQESIGLTMLARYEGGRAILSLQKYRHRGWTFYDNSFRMGRSRAVAMRFDGGVRHLNDHHCWKIKFKAQPGYLKLSTPLVEAIGWSLRDTLTRPVSDFVELGGNAFAHRYTLPRDGSAELILEEMNKHNAIGWLGK